MTSKEKNEIIRKIEIIRHKAHVSIVLMNTDFKLADIALDKGDIEHFHYYNNNGEKYRCEADAYNDAIKLFGGKPEETDEISNEIMEMEMKLKHMN